MERRKFLTSTAAVGVGAAGVITGAPVIAQDVKEITIVSTWPRDFPGLGTSAQRLAERITELSDGRLKTEYFAAGERVGAFDSFDEVASGNAQAYIAADYYWTGKHPGWAYFTSVPFGMTTRRSATPGSSTAAVRRSGTRSPASSGSSACPAVPPACRWAGGSTRR